MVRPTSSIWNHFKKETVNGKSIAICKYCGLKYLSPNATKMTKHFEKCIKRPMELFPSFSSLEENSDGEQVAVYNLSPTICSSYSENSSMDLIINHADSLPSTSSSVSEDSASKRVKIASQSQLSMNKFLDTMTSSDAEKLDSAFARAVYSSNCPLSITENVFWKEFFHEIRPSYKIPSRYELSNRLLDKEFENAQEANMNKINKAQFLTVITDGWSNVRNESIISFIIATPTPIFFKSIEASSNKHTGQYISNEINKVIEEVGEEKVVALVTDNANNMKAAWKLLQVKYPMLYAIGCSAHGLNLLLGDIAKIGTFQLLISKAKDIVKYFKNKHILLSIFTEKQKQKKGNAASTLKLPGETRWSGLLIMFESLIEGKESLQETVLNDNVDKNIRQMVLDNDLFWASIESLVCVLKPICDGISTIEADSAVLSDVPYVFYEIKNSLISLKSTPLQTDEEEKFASVLEERQKMCCQPIHLVTYILDPRYENKDVTPEDYQLALDFLIKATNNAPSAEVIADFANFQAKAGFYSNDVIWTSSKHVGPLIWWKGLLKNQPLSQLAVKLFSIPPSSASCERIFSAFGNTHTLLRNRLSNERVSKLIAVKSNLILQSKTKINLEDFIELDQ